MYETLCPQQMHVHKGGKIENGGGECRDVIIIIIIIKTLFKEEAQLDLHPIFPGVLIEAHTIIYNIHTYNTRQNAMYSIQRIST